MWTSDLHLLRETIPEKYLEWLEKPYHLSAALQRVCHELRVQVLYQGDSILADEERIFLQESAAGEHCYVRNVLLKGDNVPFCFAHITVPSRTYQQYRQAFLELGEQLLGNTLFYSNKTTARSDFQYGLMTLENINNNLLFNELNIMSALEDIFPARRSIFYMDGQFPVLVTEVFLAEIPSYRE